MRRIPASANPEHEDGKKKIIANQADSNDLYPCWRIGNFDVKGKWGLSSLLGYFQFSYTENLFTIVCNLNDDELDSTLDQLNGKEFSSYEDFWNKVKNTYHKEIPIDVVQAVQSSLKRYVLENKIYPELQNYEGNTWNEIMKYTHGDKKSNNHFVPINNLCKEARDFLSSSKFSDRDVIFSLRISGKIRIYGFRYFNFLDIIWVDLNHEIYPVNRK